MLKSPTGLNMLKFSVSEGFYALHPDEIIYLQASGSYTWLYLVKGTKGILSARTLKRFQELLPAASFLRVHSSFLINTAHIRRVEGGKKILLSNNTTIPVSKRKKTAVITQLRQEQRKIS